MQHFDSDYMGGAHPAILEKLTETNNEETPGYGTDEHCAQARAMIKEACNCPHAEVFFLVGGTQTNATVIDALLHRTQGALSADTGHIATHEAGAIEASGHKVLTLPQHLGKIDAASIRSYCETFFGDMNHEHMVEPGLVYVSYPTEYGTIYSKAELEEISAISHAHNLPLFLDGARLGYGLAAEGADLTLPDIARLCDVFYIGGTKVGALFGEAVVFTKPKLANRFFTLMKQHGGLLAKGRLLGIQFEVLLTDNLYLEISRHAVEMAMKLKAGFLSKGYTLHLDSPTNQQFIVLDNADMERLSEHATFGFWETLDADHTVVRFATSWATREEDVDALIAVL
ncbi:MAG: beta-eliminating lyase-related protein [Raoultibacter sp.]